MRIKNSLDWTAVSSELRAQMQNAPQNCRKDLARMIGHVEGLVQQLGGEEVEMRRNKRERSPRQITLLTQINESITEFEKWLMLAHLQHG
jgi:uncharacterized protein with von Willebrand factor type A (vWA) domain